MKTKLFILLITLLFINCKSDEDSSPLIDGAPGSADYFINNTSTINLDIIFIKSAELGSEISETINIPNGTSIQIFQDGIIGSNPFPEDSFSQISFYASPIDENEEPLFIISEIINEDWDIIEQNIINDYLTDTEYQLTVTNDTFQ